MILLRYSHNGCAMNNSVDRALGLLALFSREGEGLRIADFAAALGVHKSTASRLASTLEAKGFLARVDGTRGGFRLGPTVARLGVVALGGRGWAEVARPVLAELADATGETAVLSVAAGTDAIDVLQEDARHAVGARSWVGRRTPLHTTSDGKVLLAFGAGRLDPGARLEKVARRSITSRAGLERELARVRACGYATAVGEAEDGLNGVAVPIFDPEGRCVAALSVSGPDYRLRPASLPLLAERCSAAAGRILDALGWRRAGEEAA